MNSRITGIINWMMTSVFIMVAGIAVNAADREIIDTHPEFGYDFFVDKSLDELVALWGSDNPGLRSISALETARRIWKSKDPVKKLKSLLPRMQAGLESKNAHERRAVSEVVYGLWRAGGKYIGLKVRLSDEKKLDGYNAMRKELGVLLPQVCKNIKDDPDIWARAGAVDMAARIIPPYKKPADGLYEKYAKTVRPLLLVCANDKDKFLQQSAGGALNVIGIEGLPPKEVIKAMSALIDTQVTMTCEVAFKVLGQLDKKDLAGANELLRESLASDVVNRAAMVAASLLMETRPPGTAAAVIDFVTRDRHGHGYRAMEYFPIIPTFTDEELKSALPELKRFALMEEVRGRKAMSQAQGAVKRLGNKKTLKPAEIIQLNNARKIIANPPHEWVLKLFDRIGEPRPKIGVEVTGKNPERTAKLSDPPWIPKNVDKPVPLTKTDGLFGNRAMEDLPGKKGKPLPIDTRAFSEEEPESNCGYLAIQDPAPKVGLRRPFGPTGIMGNFSNRRILVVGVQPGSPAYGKIFNGDWILGVNGRNFTSVPRIGMGYAIEESEARKDGAMNLKVIRNDKPVDVTINLQPLGRTVDTWPYNCEKSDKIFNNLCEFIARHDADWVIPGALVLLASGEDKYMSKIRQEVYKIAEKGPVTSNWFTSYDLILLTEYYQKTGDPNILPAIKKFSEHILSGQTYFGGYLHNKSYFNEWKDASKVGYGEMNMAGAPCFVGLVLANECGADMNNTAFKKTIDYFKIFSGRGNVPYGAHAPYIDGPATGGKTSIAGVAFDLLGDGKAAKPLVNMSSSAYEHLWTGYHGGSYWNAFWRPLCSARDSSKSFQDLTKHNLWQYNLSRQFQGGMTAPVRGKADFDMNHDPRLVMGFGMIYALPRKGIRLTGAPLSVFARIKDLGMEDLKKLYDARDDDALKKQIKGMLTFANMTADGEDALRALLAAVESRRKAEEVELKQLETAVESKDFYTANNMITAMTKAGVPVPEQLGKAIQGKEKEIAQGEEFMKIMKQLTKGPMSFSPEDCIALTAMSKGEGFYAEQAKKAIEDYDVPADGKWNLSKLAQAETVKPETVDRLFFLISPSLDEIKTLRMKSWVGDVGASHPVDDLKGNSDLKGWYTMDYDDTKWPKELGPYLIKEKRGSEREAHLLQRYQFVAKQLNEIDNLYLKARLGPRLFRGTIYLNGEAIVEFVESPGPRGRSRGHRNLGHDTAYIKLPPVAKKLLKEGRNVLAVRASLPPCSSWSHAWLRMVDVGLGATKLGGGTFSYEPLVKGE